MAQGAEEPEEKAEGKRQRSQKEEKRTDAKICDRGLWRYSLRAAACTRLHGIYKQADQGSGRQQKP